MLCDVGGHRCAGVCCQRLARLVRLELVCMLNLYLCIVLPATFYKYYLLHDYPMLMSARSLVNMHV